MQQTIIKHLENRFTSFADLANAASDTDLTQTLDVPKSKTLGDHMWCIVGARESYSKALAAGSWTGFACSLTEITAQSVREALETSAAGFTDAVASIESWTPEREELLATLLEHEVMHEGQIIRLLYALGHEVPQSVKWA